MKEIEIIREDELVFTDNEPSDIDSTAYFQFGEDEPIEIRQVQKGQELTFILKSSSKCERSMFEFTDGNGKVFRIFLKPNNNG